MKLQQLLSLVRRACDDFDMICEGDSIAVGISGGKDSLTLLTALSALKRFYPKNFTLEAIAISCFDSDYSNITAFCKRLNIDLTIVETDIGNIVFNERKEKNPCSLCSKMRKGALNSIAKEKNINKIAYGHNKDDVIETFFMSLLYEGRINSFAPVSYLDRTDLYLIRPLIYVPESDIISFAGLNKLPILKSSCPVDGFTKREETKQLIKNLNNQYTNLDEKVFGAIKRDIW